MHWSLLVTVSPLALFGEPHGETKLHVLRSLALRTTKHVPLFGGPEAGETVRDFCLLVVSHLVGMTMCPLGLSRPGLGLQLVPFENGP